MSRDNLNKRIRIVMLIILGLVLLNNAIVIAQVEEDAAVHFKNENKIKTAEYVQGELIVKFKDGFVKKSIPQMFKHKLKLKSAVYNGSDFLDNFFQEYGVIEIKHLFLNEEDLKHLSNIPNTAEVDDFINEKVNKTKERFAKRTVRIPKGAVIPKGLGQIYILRYTKPVDSEKAANEISKSPYVEYVYPNYVIKSNNPAVNTVIKNSIPNDSLFLEQWNLKLIQAPESWEIAQGEGIVVAVMDSGIFYTHEDLADNIWSNFGEDINQDGILDEKDINGIDDDNNGYVDDFRGWDFHNNDNEPFSEDYSGNHGTGCVGIIAAVGNNGKGLIGVAPKAKIMCVARSQYGEGFISNSAKGFLYAAMNGADVISNSYDLSSYNPIIDTAIKTAYALGAVIVFSAGNDNMDVKYRYPKSMREVITVAASDENDKRADFSDYGEFVDVSAPYNVWTTLPYNKDTKYVNSFGGTSAAAPHVAGLAALILSHNPLLTNEDVKQVICVSADDIEEPGFDVKSGYGRINAVKALSIQFPLRVHIQNPEDRMSVYTSQGKLEIKGIVEGGNLNYYQLFYKIEHTQEWKAVEDSYRGNEIHDGVIGTWDISTVKAGPYLLKVTAVSQDNFVFEDKILINIDPEKRIDEQIGCEPDISGNLIAWQSGDRGSYISIYDIQKDRLYRNFHDSSKENTNVQVAGNLIVWDSWSALNNDVTACQYNLDTGDYLPLTISHLEASGYPIISNNTIAWEITPFTEQSLLKCVMSICEYKDNACQNIRTIQTNLGRWSKKQISNNLIVAGNRKQSNKQFFDFPVSLYDLNLGRELTVTSEIKNLEPAVDRNMIAWTDLHNAKSNIYYCEYDPELGLSAQQFIPVINTNTVSRQNPAICGRRIFWDEIYAEPDTGIQKQDIFMYDIDNHQIKQITDSYYLKRNPAVDGDYLVFESDGIYLIKLDPAFFTNIDGIPPIGKISILNKAGYIGDTKVSLILSADDFGGSGICEMRFSNNGQIWSTPEAYASIKTWELPLIGDVDSSGNITGYDAFLAFLKRSINRFVLTADQFIRADIDQDGRITSADVNYILSLSKGRTRESLGLLPVTYTVYARFKDTAGNWSAPVHAGIILDTTPPVITQTPVISSSGITFTAKIVDAGSGVQDVFLHWRKKVLKWRGWKVKWVWSEWWKERLTLQTDKSYAVTLTVKQVEHRDIKYYITAADKLGNAANTLEYKVKR